MDNGIDMFEPFAFQVPMNKNKKKRNTEELEERLISLVASLFGKKASSFRAWVLFFDSCFIAIIIDVSQNPSNYCLIIDGSHL